MNLFAYGTLLVPEIWLAVTGRECCGAEAILPGYEIRRVRGGDFPAIIASSDGIAVPGRVFRDLDAETIQCLDRYEDSFYERIDVPTRDPAGQALPSQAYVVPEQHRDVLSDDPWTLDWFRKHAMEGYIARLFS